MTSKKYSSANQKRCVACGACVKECPLGAIEIVDGCYAKIAKERCVGCGKCIAICPAGCIELLQREDFHA